RSADRGDLRAAVIDLKNVLQQEPENGTARLELGRVSLRLGDLDSAVRELEYAQELGVPYEQIALSLAQAHLMRRDHAAALECLDKATFAADAERKEALRIRGSALLDLKRAAEAQQAFEDALRIDERLLPALLGLAAARYELAGLDEARSTLDVAVSRVGRDPQVDLMWGSFLSREQRFAEAAAVFRTALTASDAAVNESLRALALAGIADSQMALGDTKAALETTADLIAAAPGSTAAHFLRARALFLSGSYEEARSDLQRLVVADETNTPAQLLLGAINFVQGNLGQADMLFSSVLAAEPGNNFARKLLADTRLRQKKPRDALAVLAPAVKAGDRQSLELAARASVEAGDLDAGLGYLEQGLSAHPEDTRLALQLAAGYIAAGRLQRAVELLEKVPEGAEAGYRREVLLVAAQLRFGNLSEALRMAQRLVATHPADPLAQAMLGGLLVGQGRQAEARAHFSRAVELDPRNAAALVNLGKLDLLEGRLEAAEQRLKAALKLSPASPAALVALAQLELARGQPSAATAWLQTARERNANAAEPRVLLAQYFLEQRELDKAEALVREVLEFAPANTGALNVLALTLSASGRHAEGIATLQQVARQTPYSSAAQVNLARALLDAGETVEALRAAEESLKVDPDQVATLAFTAAVALEAGELGRAHALLKRLQSAAPENPATFTLAGDVAMREKRYGAAADAYQSAGQRSPSRALVLREFIALKAAQRANPSAPLEKWLSRQPDDTRVRLVLAQEQQTAGAMARAAENYEAILRANADDTTALNNLAWVHVATAPEKALPLAKRAHELRPGEPQIADTYGWALLANGEVDRAVELLEAAAQQAPQVPDIQYHYAAALARAGRAPEARSRLEQLLGGSAAFGARTEAQELLKTLGKSEI
ncbi:MAG TPA: XrtA/PEP-CTERM system TPR-repeat protein PrsT, partial [Gammaproteobacteria bacterium]|nr:XrtA/PEP-CTERM system TPR-repeat protein PrsT [Gammaproteobacteria bacterium]